MRVRVNLGFREAAVGNGPLDGGGVAGVPMWDEATAKGRKAVGLGMAKFIRLPTFISLGMVEVLMSSPFAEGSRVWKRRSPKRLGLSPGGRVQVRRESCHHETTPLKNFAALVWRGGIANGCVLETTSQPWEWASSRWEKKLELQG